MTSAPNIIFLVSTYIYLYYTKSINSNTSFLNEVTMIIWLIIRIVRGADDADDDDDSDQLGDKDDEDGDD